MASRGGSKKPPIPDFHLWHDVAQTVLPLKPRRTRRKLVKASIEAPLPLPPAAPPAPPPPPTRAKTSTTPPYQPPQTPGRPPSGVIEPRLRQKLGRGRVPIDGTLDLHGMRQDEAFLALVRYLRARSAKGDRTILV